MTRSQGKSKTQSLKDEGFFEVHLPSKPRSFSSAEALALVAFGDADALSRRMQEFPTLWPNAFKLERIWQRDIAEIMESHKPLSSFIKLFDRQLALQADGLISSMSITQDEADRARIQHGVAFYECLRIASEEWKTREADILAGSNTLREAALAGEIKVFGRLGSRPRLQIVSASHQEIPTAVFADPYRLITRDGWLALSRETPLDRLQTWRKEPASDWADLRFLINLKNVQRPDEGDSSMPAALDDDAKDRTSVKRPPSKMAAEAATERISRRPGPAGKMHEAIYSQMLVDYEGNPGKLDTETLEVLCNGYESLAAPLRRRGKALSKATIEKARKEALSKLRQDIE